MGCDADAHHSSFGWAKYHCHKSHTSRATCRLGYHRSPFVPSCPLSKQRAKDWERGSRAHQQTDFYHQERDLFLHSPIDITSTGQRQASCEAMNRTSESESVRSKVTLQSHNADSLST